MHVLQKRPALNVQPHSSKDETICLSILANVIALDLCSQTAFNQGGRRGNEKCLLSDVWVTMEAQGIDMNTHIAYG